MSPTRAAEERPRTPPRRQGLKKGRRVGLLYQVSSLLSALTLQTVLTAEWLSRPLVQPLIAEVNNVIADVGGHVEEVAEVFKVQSHRVDVMQVFGGEGGITRAALGRGMTAVQVIDRKYGWDLTRKADLDQTYSLYYGLRPRFVSVELPCTYYTNITHLNYATPARKQLLRRKWQREKPFIHLARDIVMGQLALGDIAMVENPATSRLWAQRDVQKLMADDRLFAVRCDMCAFGATHVKTGKPIKHPTRLLVTHSEFFQLEKKCDRTHKHESTFGDPQAVRAAGVYTDRFCRAVVRVVEEILKGKGHHHEAYAEGIDVRVGEAATSLPEPTTAPLAEPGEADGRPDPMGGGEDADFSQVKSPDLIDNGFDKPDGRTGVGAITFTKKAAAGCKPAELVMLRKLHCNLGHPSNEDLGRSLRLKGARSQVVDAVKGLVCNVCQSQQRPSARRPAHLHFVQDFGDDVGFDCLELKDVEGKTFWFFSIVDLATTFQVVTLIRNHTAKEFAEVFDRCWASWAGVPDRVHFDMEGGFVAGALSELFQSFGTVQLPIAGQAHWQLGRVERQGGWWKELAARTIEHASVKGEDEMRTMSAMVSGAKNALRRRAGFSPAQWVLGRDPKLPADLVDGTAEVSAHSLACNDEKIRRRYAIRTAARESFMRMQNDDQLRRAMLARARTVQGPISAGELCYIFRMMKSKEKAKGTNRNMKKGVWRGPCVVIGHQGENTWVSLGGSTMLVAPEHIKAVSPEDVWFPNGRDEMSEAIRQLNRVRDNIQNDEEYEVADLRPQAGEPDATQAEKDAAWQELLDGSQAELDDVGPLAVDEVPTEVMPELPAQPEQTVAAAPGQPYGPEEFKRRRANFEEADGGDLGPVPRRLRTKTTPAEDMPPAYQVPTTEDRSARGRARSRTPGPRASDQPERPERADPGEGAAEQPVTAERTRSRSAPRIESSALQASVITDRIKRKQQDKEIKWKDISESDKPIFREAAAKQWSEWQKYETVAVLSPEESDAVRKTVDPKRILPSRYVYRDKNAPLRSETNNLPVKAKARLCVGGHMDPRLSQGELRTDAPTVTRNSTMLFFTIVQRFGLDVVAADVEAAFMQGDPQHGDQELYMAQPREGLPGVRQGSLVRILKGVFGLATAPRHWWAKLRRLLLEVRIELGHGYEFHFKQHSLDPAVYYGHDRDGELVAVVVVHVDDLLIGVSPRYPQLYTKMHGLLPWGEWRGLPFAFCGKEAWRDEEGIIHLTQSQYAQNIEEIPLSKERKLELQAAATATEFSDNRSALGALGWLTTQTRPDLAAGVAMAQRTQNRPLVMDLIETNRLIKLARKYSEVGLEFPALKGPICMVTYHDASWANADESSDSLVGRLVESAMGRSDKSSRPKVRSQAGYASFIAEAGVLRGDKARCCLVDWRSATIKRVCRSTLAAETMSGVDALGCAQISRAIFASLEFPSVSPQDISPELLPLAQVTDCASLYDTMHKDGFSRLPSERRLLLDLVGLREMLEEEIQARCVADDARSQLPLYWVPTQEQLGDQFTKRSDGSAIRSVLKGARLSLVFQEPDEATRAAEAH